MASNEAYIKKMYDGNLAATKQQLTTDYESNLENLEQEKAEAQKAEDAALNRTYVEAQKAAKNYEEVQNAYGITSGAMAQARLAQNNQLQSDMTTIRAARQEADAQIERQRSILAKEYAAAITKAQQENDLAKAQALYEAAAAEDAALRKQQEDAAKLLAEEGGDYTLYQQLYGLTDSQMAALTGQSATQGIPESLSATLKAMYPSGTVGNKAYWDSLVALYGEEALLAAGFQYTEHRTSGGGGTLTMAPKPQKNAVTLTD